MILNCIWLLLLITICSRRPKSRAASAASAAEDVAIPRQGVADFSLGDTISNIERRVEAGGPADEFDGTDDVLPQAAEGMGSGKAGLHMVRL